MALPAPGGIELKIFGRNGDVENLDYIKELVNTCLSDRFENNDKELKKKVLKALDLEAIKIIIPEYNKIDIKIFKDLHDKTKYYLRTHKAFIMINLVDNKNSTIFCSMEEEDLCKASNKKNNGVFHILHKGPIMHHVENNSNEDRYTTIAFIK